MLSFVTSPAFSVVAVALIVAVFVLALVLLSRELNYVKVLTDRLGYSLAVATSDEREASLAADAIHDEMRIARSGDRGAASKVVRGWEMRAQRLEPSLAFWVDLLRQLGLLFTVVGLGLAFASDARPETILEPLGLAVWTTVAGLALSIWLSAQFGTRVPVWADACERNISAWRASHAGPSDDGAER